MVRGRRERKIKCINSCKLKKSECQSLHVSSGTLALRLHFLPRCFCFISNTFPAQNHYLHIIFIMTLLRRSAVIVLLVLLMQLYCTQAFEVSIVSFGFLSSIAWKNPFSISCRGLKRPLFMENHSNVLARHCQRRTASLVQT